MIEIMKKNLERLAEIFSGSDAKELRSIMADNMIFYSEFSRKSIEEIDTLIERMVFVQQNAKKVRAVTATVVSVPIACDFPAGTRCVLLYYGDQKNNPDKALIRFDENGRICSIYISNDDRIKYQIDRPEDCPTDSEIEQRIAELFNGYEDDSEIVAYIAEYESMYSGDIYDFAFREAIRQGVAEYIEEYAENFDLNDGDGYSTYLHETDDEEIQDLLMDLGAFRSWDEYDDCKFAVETINGSILAFDSDFQREAFAKYLEICGITADDVISMFEDEEEADEFDAEHDRYFTEDMSALGVFVEDGVIVFEDKVDSDGGELRDLLEELGWDCTFEGERWKLETNGVYFIR